MFSRVEVLT